MAKFSSVAVFVLGVSVAIAQTERASVIGNVTDSSGAPMAGVEVTVTNEGTNTVVRLTTDDAGAYQAVNLIPGSYSINATRSGFRAAIFRNFVLQVGQSARLDIQMEVGSVEQAVEVTGAIPLLQTENASVGQVISKEAVNSLPLNGRNFVQLAILAPGVSGLDYAQPNTINTGRRPDELRPGGTAIQVNGGVSFSNQVLLDGIDNTEMISQTFIVRPSVEGIQEFKVLTNNAGAEYGRTIGAVVVVTTKSGTNQFHGSAFEFLRNERFDARNFFARPDAPKPPFKLNQYGASLGGPVLKGRTFFFANYEGYREVFGDTQVVTVPVQQFRDGNFSNASTVPNGIYDPLTTANNVRQRFANDTIPRSRFDAIGAGLVNMWPAPQRAGFANNFVANPVKRSKVHRADGRLDHQLSQKDTLFFRFSADWSDLTIPDTFDRNIGGNEASFAGDDIVKGRSLVGAWTHTFSASTIGDFRYGYTQFNMALLPTTLSNPLWRTIPGRQTDDPFQPSAPIVGTTGYAGLGNARSTPLIRDQKTHEIVANISTLKNNHNLKYGIDFRLRTTGETASPPGESAFGRWVFDSAYSRNPTSPGGTGETIATMLLGYPIAIRRDVFLPRTATLHTNELNFFIRDEWRVNGKLTLNFGVHYEVNTPFTEVKDQWVNFDPATGKQLIAGRDGVGRTAGINTDYQAIAPRFSFAYQANKKTVFRGGYGLFYFPQGNAGTNIRQFRQPPYDFVVNLPFSGNDIPATTTSQGFPIVTTVPDLTKGPALFALRGVTPNFRNGQSQQFNFSAQRELGKELVATLSFVGSAAAKLYWARNINQPDPGPGAIDPRRPYAAVLPGVTGITWLESSANSFFSSMQTTVEKRYSSGFYFLGNWTWGHTLDNFGGDGGNNGPIPQNPRNRRADWASSNSDVRHRVNLAASYLLPFGPGRKYANAGGVSGHIFGGWEIGGLAVLQSGLPFTVLVPGSPANTGSASRANAVAGANPYPANRSIALWFDPAAFATPPAFTWGTLGRNTLNAPALYNFDFSIAKKFTFAESRQLQFRSEFFNGFNHPQFGLPNATIAVGGAGTITSTQRSSRQMQLALRLSF
ncbi:MAG TPA: carboxypeptidase regulatory-like domain-containing protein [Bryobacteraceae bacterium]|nr:carboxypeptidase regulatory-like domain-containing protein [Bryobacteraceae bacterium]